MAALTSWAPWLWAYGAALLTLGVLDGVWLGFLARNFYQREMVAVAAESFRVAPAVLFYLGYPAGVLALALHPLPAGLGEAALRAGLVGLVAYATYDLSNMATLKAWSLQLVLVDVAWGIALSAAMGGVAYNVLRRF